MVSTSNLRKFRLKEGITIAELSRAANLSAKTASKCERAPELAAPTTRHRLVNALNQLCGSPGYGFSDIFPQLEEQPGGPAAEEADGPVITEAMRKNAAWLEEHEEDLTPYEGMWVAICGGRIVASGQRPKEALDRAAQAGHAGEATMLDFVSHENIVY